jgi:hypothetical protein
MHCACSNLGALLACFGLCTMANRDCFVERDPTLLFRPKAYDYEQDKLRPFSLYLFPAASIDLFSR